MSKSESREKMLKRVLGCEASEDGWRLRDEVNTEVGALIYKLEAAGVENCYESIICFISELSKLSRKYGICIMVGPNEEMQLEPLDDEFEGYWLDGEANLK